ncbi:type 1 glutamine amidotransferase [Phaeodactylibacter xiamenensis]|jgi:GMP synthase-like glutamine amidotransferase|uniref:GMP synthase n=1 Tax=Phaeodactylibacter xiamenensis TaxID=1524460 RepID=A0A098SAI4_9BACT|nr:homoserine O-succinyltransferase [Phaeodactylibacter xiamenensis]KGE89146.1 GMP synthase [Phaeodactylibacter xiamenensis]MCR9050317.1 homoserine O-succinyltransferase [bacterium]
MSSLRLAILDMYDNTPNQGMRCIQDIVRRFEAQYEWKIFDVRGKAEVPGMDYDIYISTGGPGSPFEGDGIWDVRYFDWMQQVWDWNLIPGNRKKHVFFICHSFQMAVRHFELAEVTERKSMSFGTFRCHMTDAGASDPNFQGLPNPFFIADFRHWQCIQPDEEKLAAMGADILALEKIRPHVPLERAVMAIRFSPEIIGTQFHPEADPDGMREHFMDPARQKAVVDEHGEEKYLRMIKHLRDSDKIGLTHEVVLPLFLHRAINALEEAPAAV